MRAEELGLVGFSGELALFAYVLVIFIPISFLLFGHLDPFIWLRGDCPRGVHRPVHAYGYRVPRLVHYFSCCALEFSYRGISCWNGPGTLASSPIALSMAPGVKFPVSFELAVGGGGANRDSACVL